jgi:hypothetical protein
MQSDPISGPMSHHRKYQGDVPFDVEKRLTAWL